MNYTVQNLEEKHNKQLETVIRNCLIEFGANREGFAWSDPFLSHLSTEYNKEGTAYFVAIDENGKVVGGAGIGKIKGFENICELQKMYVEPNARGTGIAHELIKKCLEFAKTHYEKCYIETLKNMVAANKFYQKYGFSYLDKPLISSDHYSCDTWLIKEL